MSTTQILLAEDNRGDVLLIRRALAEYRVDHELHVAYDGEQAVDFLAQVGQPGAVPCLDLVLLDVNLPRVDGPQILVELRNHPVCASVPVIVLSSSNASRDRARFTDLGISRYFLKPSDLEEFMRLGAVVQDVLAHWEPGRDSKRESK